MERDLGEILRALQTWSHSAYENTIPPPESPNGEDWLGFEAFVKRATGGDEGTAM